ncbi:MAG: cadmium-translocating P-type ATPase [Clostridiales bacterium]|nr:cadmium-translocating P-type ATPase [Clostridiales bacterium]
MKKRIRKLLIITAILAVLIILDFCINIPLYIRLPLYLTIYFALGINIFKKAFRNIIYGKVLDENFLMTIATIGAFVIGQYIEGVAVILIYQAGEIFQNISVRHSRESVAKLMDIRPDYANLVTGNEVLTTNPSDVKIGDIIEVKPGERIPLDAIVISGNSAINTSMMSGESMPKIVNIGDKIISGCINLDGVIRAKVTATFTDSTVSKVLTMIEDASNKKSHSENYITKFAKHYTPIICILAVLLAIIPPIFIGGWENWIYRACCFLVVSCPCALVISIPLAFFASIGCASRHGILIKGSSYIELLTKIDTYVFDKTGTITKGKFEIIDVSPKSKQREILRLASIAEAKNTHPIAKLLHNYKPNETIIDNYKYKNIPGEGVIAKSENETIICGNAKLLCDNNITINDNETIHNTIIHIARNNEYIGKIVIGDELKPNSSDIIAQIINSKKDVKLLSGDNKETTQNIANIVGVTDYCHDLLPNEKTKIIEEIIQRNKKVVFVGDGINDAPSLMRADIGISMGELGSDSAIEASDIVIIDDNLEKIIDMNIIAKRTMRIVRQNVIFSLGIKFAILILSALGLSNMWWAIFGDVGVSIIAILNSMRAMHYKKK